MRAVLCNILASIAVTACLGTLVETPTFSQNGVKLTQNVYNKVLANPFDETAFEEFLAASPTAIVADRKYYIVEGDLLLTKEQTRASILFQAQGSQPANVPSGELLVMLSGGQPVFWPKSNRALTYSVRQSSFPSTDAYKLVVSSMTAAAKAWEDVCSECGLSIRYRPGFDDATSVGQVTFTVQFNNKAEDYIALSFFPNDPNYKRIVNVAPAYLTTSYDKVGVFRHEIGHILGYRHEHIRGISGCKRENNEWKPLTTYDPHSVMHYYCGGAGTMTFDLTDSDKAGHRLQYQ